jgi:2-dehydropantoate 2-reductase
MRVLILGAGGVGGYFGGLLAAAGVDVSFLVRPARAETLARRGLVITSPTGNLRLPVTTLTQAETPFDAILLSCKAYDLDTAIEAIAPAVGPATLILPLLNGLRHLDRLDARFGRERVLGGLCHIGVRMDDAGDIVHLDGLQRFVLGARVASQTAAAARLHAVLDRGGFAPRLSAAIEQEMWEKFAFLATYAGMTTLLRASVGAIVQADEGEALMIVMLDECIAAATAAGYPPRPASVADMRATLTNRESSGTASMFRDMAANRRTEHDHILGDMLMRARSAGHAAPLLGVSVANMQIYDSRRDAGA